MFKNKQNILGKIKLSQHKPCKHVGGVEAQLNLFLILPLDAGHWVTSRPGRFTPYKEPRYRLNPSWLGPRRDMDISNKR